MPTDYKIVSGRLYDSEHPQPYSSPGQIFSYYPVEMVPSGKTREWSQTNQGKALDQFGREHRINGKADWQLWYDNFAKSRYNTASGAYLIQLQNQNAALLAQSKKPMATTNPTTISDLWTRLSTTLDNLSNTVTGVSQSVSSVANKVDDVQDAATSNNSSASSGSSNTTMYILIGVVVLLMFGKKLFR